MENKPINTAQLNLISLVQEMIPSNLSLVDVIAQSLEISTDSAYRRIRGETVLSIDEAAILCKRFKISFDSYINSESTSVAFRYNALFNEEEFKNHLASIRDDMKMIKKANNPKIIYAAIDIPIFHHFQYSELSAFKMFYWLTAVVNDPGLADQKFDPDKISKELMAIGKEIYDLYMEIPSVEIWSDATVNSLLKQIDFYWDSGKFSSKDQALRVCDEAILEFETLQKQAEEYSKKSETGEMQGVFELYCSDVEIGNNCIQVTVGEIKNMYLTFNTFNALVTGNQPFCEITNAWIENLISKATLISGVSEKIRNQFFTKIFNELYKLRNKIASE